MFGVIENIFFPEYCFLCGRFKTEKSAVCADCRKLLSYFDGSGGFPVCDDENGFIFLDGIFGLYNYDRNVQKLMFKYKTEGNKKLSDFFVGEILNYSFPDGLTFDYISYVPLHWKKFLKRGFNQSELIASKLSYRLKIKKACFLRKRHTCGSQKDCNFSGRYLNAVGAYEFISSKSDFLRGRNVLLVDDVYTTGATLNECSRILKKNGANKVFSLTVGITNNKK